jgi:hypothetical protein
MIKEKKQQKNEEKAEKVLLKKNKVLSLHSVFGRGLQKQHNYQIFRVITRLSDEIF